MTRHQARGTSKSRGPVPLLDLKAQYETIRDELQQAINGVLESQRFILGPEVEALEQEIGGYCQCQYAVGVSSGTDALLVSLMACDIQPGDEVITTPYTFFATAGCIARLNAKPVFVDIDARTCNLDPELVEARITQRTRAIIPVHLYGQTAQMDPIVEIAKRHGLRVIEDAAQAIGAEYNGRRAGSLGDLGAFSFFPSKNLGAMGDGGIVTSNDAQLADRVRLLRTHGYRPKYYNKVVGGNFRLDALQAAIVRVKLRYLERWTAQRQAHAQRYRELLTTAHRVRPPEPDGGAPADGIALPCNAEHRRHVYNQFVIRCQRRDELRAHLQQRQIGSEIYYPVPMHVQECFAPLGHHPGDFPRAESAAAQTLALPVYPELTLPMQQAVVDAIAAFFD